MKSLLLPLTIALILVSNPASAQTPAPPAPAGPAVPAAPTPPKPSAGVSNAVRNVGPTEFEALRKATNAVVLDVRTEAEFADGHLPGAKLVDFRSATFADQVAGLDKSKLYLVHCAGGVRSAKACIKMTSLGFTNLVNLEGGISAWQEAGKPVEK